MNETKTQHENEGGTSQETACPACNLMKMVSATRRKHSAFFDHLINARMEVLRAFKYVIDQQLSCLEEKKGRREDGKKAVKIPVE